MLSMLQYFQRQDLFAKELSFHPQPEAAFALLSQPFSRLPVGAAVARPSVRQKGRTYRSAWVSSCSHSDPQTLAVHLQGWYAQSGSYRVNKHRWAGVRLAVQDARESHGNHQNRPCHLSDTTTGRHFELQTRRNHDDYQSFSVHPSVLPK